MSEGRRVVETGGGRTCFEHVSDWLKYKNKGEWLNEMKGSLSLTASIIATMTFQLGTNPPGGVIQASFGDRFTKCIDDECPGLSVMAILDPDDYKQFLISNAVSFFASISVCLMLVSGIPLNHRFPTWLLSIGMCVAITSLGYSYTLGVGFVTPDSTWGTFDSLFHIAFIVWCCLLGIVALFLTIRSFIWCITKIYNQSK